MGRTAMSKFDTQSAKTRSTKSDGMYVRISPVSVAITEIFPIGVKSYRRFKTWKGRPPEDFRDRNRERESERKGERDRKRDIEDMNA